MKNDPYKLFYNRFFDKEIKKEIDKIMEKYDLDTLKIKVEWTRTKVIEED